MLKWATALACILMISWVWVNGSRKRIRMSWVSPYAKRSPQGSRLEKRGDYADTRQISQKDYHFGEIKSIQDWNPDFLFYITGRRSRYKTELPATGLIFSCICWRLKSYYLCAIQYHSHNFGLRGVKNSHHYYTLVSMGGSIYTLPQGSIKYTH